MTTPNDQMATKWKEESQYADGTGYKIYYCQCPQYKNKHELNNLYRLYYSPTTNRVWFFDEQNRDPDSTRMTCSSWEHAELIKKMLTMTDGARPSHWMQPAST